MKRQNGAFLVCDECGYCCYLRGFMAGSLSQSPPPCPGCTSPTRVTRREPWREALGNAS